MRRYSSVEDSLALPSLQGSLMQQQTTPEAFWLCEMKLLMTSLLDPQICSSLVYLLSFAFSPSSSYLAGPYGYSPTLGVGISSELICTFCVAHTELHQSSSFNITLLLANIFEQSPLKTLFLIT